MGVNALSSFDAGLELYRRSFRKHIWRYYLASAPFALLLLWITERAAHLAVTQVWGPATLLTAAYAARILGTGAYTRRLREILEGSTAPIPGPGTAAEIWAQSALFALWILGLPFLLGTGLFYTAAQYVPTQPARPLRSALRLALRTWMQQWVFLALALIFGGIVFINLGAVGVLLPSLLHSLLGLGGVLGFTGTGGLLLSSSAFWLALALIVYLALDPLMKCVMAAAFHRQQAVHSGTDLAARIAQLPRPAVTAALAGVATPAALGRALQAELRQPAYAWHSGRPSDVNAALGHFLGRVLAPFVHLGHAIAIGIGHIWKWILRWLFGTPGASPTTAPSHSWEHAAWVLAAVCLLLLIVLLWRRARRPPPPTEPEAPAPQALDVATASASQQGQDQWFSLARQLQAAGELRLAFRAAFLGGLAGLAQRHLLTIRRDRTNQEYGEELARRAPLHQLPGALVENFQSATRDFDEVWYGGRGVDADRLERFLATQQEFTAHG